MRVLIFGATGMVGQGVLLECLVDTRVTKVVAVGRTVSGKHNSKLSEIVLPDIFAIAGVTEQLSGFDACFFCLGVSSLGMSEAAYTRITFDLTMMVARELARCNPAMTFIYVTGQGTRRDSRQMWARVKAHTEDELCTLGFKAVYSFRPGLIQPLHGVVSKTRWVMGIYAVIRPFAAQMVRRLPGFTTTTERLGQAMINVAANGYAMPVLESRDINIAGADVSNGT
jgi:uncharacterized protein YbjT (DUF2867 family)